MPNKLEAYLEEISHFLSGRAEREEILSEIRSHILEKAAAEHGGTGNDAVMYLPMAFLADLGLVALVLYFVTQSGKDVKLPWPKIGVDLDEVKPPKKVFWGRVGTAVGAVVMLAVTDLALYLTDGADPKPLLMPGPGRYLSLIVIAQFAVSTMTLLIKLLTRSPWVKIVSNVISLGLIGLILRQTFDGLFAITMSEKLMRVLKANIKITLLVIALVVTYELVRDIVRVSRRKLAHIKQY